MSNQSKFSKSAIAGFILSFLGGFAIIGLILSIVGIIKTKKYGLRGRGLAIAGVIISIFVFSLTLVLSGNLDFEKLTSDKPYQTGPTAPTYSFEELKQSSLSMPANISYRDLLRSVETYKGQYLCTKGYVFQVVSATDYLISTSGGTLVPDNNIRLKMNAAPQPKILEEDRVEFCGEIQGDYTYETRAGQVTVPYVYVYSDYIKII